VAQRVLSILNDVEESIYFVTFFFRRDDFGRALAEMVQAGITVAGVAEERMLSCKGRVSSSSYCY
jgi:phosphatidylserine/phosphatidylglycerophosphate/cardiolipin synthase-like enzyme